MKQQLNDEAARNELAEMIASSLLKSKQRQHIAYVRRTRKPTDWLVQYCPCGHSRQLFTDEEHLIEAAKKRQSEGRMDALIIESTACPICKEAANASA